MIVTQRNGREVRASPITVRSTFAVPGPPARPASASGPGRHLRRHLSYLVPSGCGRSRSYQKIPQAFVHAVRSRVAFPVTGSTR